MKTDRGAAPGAATPEPFAAAAVGAFRDESDVEVFDAFAAAVRAARPVQTFKHFTDRTSALAGLAFLERTSEGGLCLGFIRFARAVVDVG